MKLHKSLFFVLLAAILGTVLLASTLAAAPDEGNLPDGLPLGNPGLKETRTTERVAPGVAYTRIGYPQPIHSIAELRSAAVELTRLARTS